MEWGYLRQSSNRLRATTNSVLLPEAEPGTVRELFVVPAICGGEIAQVKRSGVWDREDAFQQLDVGNGLFRVHSTSMIHNRGSEVKSPVCRGLSSWPCRRLWRTTNCRKFSVSRRFDVLRWGSGEEVLILWY